MKNKKLDIIRHKIDKLDYMLLNLIKKRTNLVNQVIKVKKSKKDIFDRKRINAVLGNIKRNSIKKEIDPKITKNIWSSMIKSYIEYERKNFNKK